MTEKYLIVPVTDNLETHEVWLERGEALHRSLRALPAAGYKAYLRIMFAEGAELAILHVEGVPRSLAVYRCHHTTFHGFRFYVDDLVTDESARGGGFGSALLAWCEQRARERSCDTFALESGVQRALAHRFYFRHGLSIHTLGFVKNLS
jgi:GNAT superfamily N-acetyltransferase